jgi:hypothetical protein
MLSEQQRAEFWQHEILSTRSQGKPVLERNVLVALAASHLSGARIDPSFQELANAVISKAIITGQLPKAQDGRRKGNHSDGTLSYDDELVAGEYFAICDSGETRDDALASLSLKHNKDRRTIERAVREGRKWHGSTLEARQQQRRDLADVVAERLALAEPLAESSDVRDDSPPELAGLAEQVALQRLEHLIRPVGM